MSTTVKTPNATATATSGCERRHGRGAIAASAAMRSSGPGAMSSRSTASATDQQAKAATRAQSRGPVAGGFAGRGSTHSDRSASKTTRSA